MLRVVAGTAKGRKIKVPETEDVRPTTDRAREAVFNSLYSLGAPMGMRVLDLFAGSGAMGLEALSRGAESVTFVDSSKTSIKTVHENLNTLDFVEQAELVRFDSVDFLKTQYQQPQNQQSQSEGRHYDLVFLDPPFAFNRWNVVFELLDKSKILVIESDREIETDDVVWEAAKTAKYSRTYIKVCVKK